jgi:penicillin-insensitive murein endopeptidase
MRFFPLPKITLFRRLISTECVSRALVALLTGASLVACGSQAPDKTRETLARRESPIAPAASPTAQEQFGAMKWPAGLPGPSVIGSYTRGCLARAQALPLDGGHWQVMRPSRNRYWGHPSLISFVERLSDNASKRGWHGLLVGDLGQPRGGPASSGHASHQIGLDVDIWLTAMPARRYSDAERETTQALSMLKNPSSRVQVDRKLFTPSQAMLIKQAARFDEVVRIFVNPAIKVALCRSAGRDRTWLGKVRPWRGHDEHMHVRLRCPQGETMCQQQDPPPDGDGCGEELASWMRSTDWLPGNGPEPVPAPVPMNALPDACVQVIQAPDVQRTAINP